MEVKGGHTYNGTTYDAKMRVPVQAPRTGAAHADVPAC
jgi:hypothetical protein